MARIESWFNQDLQEPVRVRSITGNVFSADNQGNLVGVKVFDNGQPAVLSGTVSANIIRSDGGTVAATGTYTGNAASVVLPAAAYSVPGMIAIVLKITDGSVVTTLLAVVVNVYRSSTDTIVDPGTIIPSIQTLISSIDTAVSSIPADYSSLWTSLAPAYSTSGTYAVGDYVTYNGGLYRCVSAISSGESWTAAHWTAAKVGPDVSALMSAFDSITNLIVVGENVTPGFYPGDNSAGLQSRYANARIACSPSEKIYLNFPLSSISIRYLDSSKALITTVSTTTTDENGQHYFTTRSGSDTAYLEIPFMRSMAHCVVASRTPFTVPMNNTAETSAETAYNYELLNHIALHGRKSSSDAFTMSKDNGNVFVKTNTTSATATRQAITFATHDMYFAGKMIVLAYRSGMENAVVFDFSSGGVYIWTLNTSTTALQKTISMPTGNTVDYSIVKWHCTVDENANFSFYNTDEPIKSVAFDIREVLNKSENNDYLLGFGWCGNYTNTGNFRYYNGTIYNETILNGDLEYIGYKEHLYNGIISEAGNLFDRNAAGIETGKYISAISSNTETWTTSDGFNESDYIPVIPGDMYCAYYNGNSALSGLVIACYNSSKTPVSMLDDAHKRSRVYTIPEGIEYVKLAYNNTREISLVFLHLPYWISGTDSEMLAKAQEIYNGRFKTVAKQIEIISNSSGAGAQWNGKIWYAYGSSLTFEESGHYADLVAEWSGMQLTNRGIGGGAFVKNTNILDRVISTSDGKENADLITIEIGANDAGQTLGDPHSTDTSTVCGAVNYALKKMFADNDIKAQVVLMASYPQRWQSGDPPTPWYADHQYNSGKYWYEFVDAIRKIADTNGLYFIPFNALGLGYVRSNGQNNTKYITDQIHPTVLGGYNVAQGVWSYLKNIPNWYTSLPE